MKDEPEKDNDVNADLENLNFIQCDPAQVQIEIPRNITITQ